MEVNRRGRIILRIAYLVIAMIIITSIAFGTYEDHTNSPLTVGVYILLAIIGYGVFESCMRFFAKEEYERQKRIDKVTDHKS